MDLQENATEKLMDQIFTVKTVFQKHLEKVRKVFAAYICLENAVIWLRGRVSGMSREHMVWKYIYFKEYDVNASVFMNGELSESFGVGCGFEMGVRYHHGCSVFIWMVV